MLLSHLTRLCVLLPSITSAWAQNPNPTLLTSLPLPTSLEHLVPTCAQTCLSTSLFTQFPLACTSPVDIKCLCSHYSTTGSSLGELALACIYASCPIVDGQAASAYNVCVGQEDAVTQTQTAVTVTVTSSTTSPPNPPLSATAFTPSTPPSPTPETIVADSFTLAATSSSSRPTISGAAAPVTSPPTMKPAQIAGLVAAVVAAFMLATGLMTLSIFIRKRRERNEMMMYDEEKRAAFPADRSSGFSIGGSPVIDSPSIPPKQFTLRQPPGQGPFLRYPASTARRNGPETATEGPLSFPSRGEPELRVTSRSEARQSTDSSASIPIEGIGVAISAEATNKHKRPSAYGPRHPLPADTRQQRRQTLCFTLEASGRPDSVLSQDTVFEEDDGRSRHRRSALLPAPPVPIPPIRTLRPARPIAHLPPIATQQEVPAIRSQAIQQASLSLAIPVRHSRSLAEVFPSPPEARPAVAMLAPAIHISATSTPQEAGAISAASSGYGTEGYIPDYYFRQHTPMPTLSAPHYAQRTPKEAPQLAAPKPKKSASTVSRTTSTSTHVRDSISSQTSFESIDSNDPTPEEDDGDKELSDAARLSPVAESPISSLRYPKIPRASNQRVPRSPQSPGSPTSQQGQAPFRRPAEPSALLVKRRGEREALKLENGLRMDSVQRPDGEGRNGNHQQVTRTASMQTRDPSASNDRTQPRGRRTRVQSGNELRSPAMYGLEAVRAVDSVRHGEVETVPKSPAWVPNLTPKRHGEDLFLDVSYTKPVT